MNKDFKTAKEHFKETGYCSISIKDIDIDFYNFLESNFICDEKNNLQNKFYEFRFDSDKIETRYISNSQSYEDALSKKEELLSLYKDASISQCWYFNFSIDYNHKDILEKGIFNICKYFYEELNRDNFLTNELQFTYYDKGCRFTPHSDGMSVNLCSVIIYLNKNYNKENGGLLLLNGEEVIPEFGNVALMDLSKHDISHGVTEVTNGPGRYAILSFPRLKN